MGIVRGIFLWTFISVSLSAQLVNNVSIQNVVDKISRINISEYVTELQDFGTRFMLADERFEVAQYLKEEFRSMGFSDVVLDTFTCSTQIGSPYFRPDIDTTTIQVNVVATLPGTQNPDDIYIICGHYDSFCQNANPFIIAPGADDNASGTTCVLEAARAIMSSGYQPKATIKFICFGAEELMNFGDSGSGSYAVRAGERGDRIKLVINNDMIGYNEEHISNAKVNVAPTMLFTKINDAISICETYGAISYLGEGYAGADLRGFTQMGYRGIYFEENDFAKQVNYHQSTDRAENMDFLYMTEVVKAATAVLIGMQDVFTSNEKEDLPESYLLGQNYPNPFNPSTTIDYVVAVPGFVTIKVYDTLGREVKELVNGEKTPGNYKITFNAENFSSGVYYYEMQANGFHTSRKLMLLR